MLFVTNRALEEGPESRFGRRVRFSADPEPRASLFFCERLGADDYREIGSAAFFDRLRRSSAEHVLIYLHGFSNRPEPHVFPRAALLARRLRGLGLAVEVVPLIWPCGERVGWLRDYFDDQDAADMSGFAFARLVGKFLDWRQRTGEPCTRHLHLLAHSMGNRVLRAAVGRWYGEHGAVPALFRNVFMVAADVANECLEPGRSGWPITRCARNVVVYYAPDDFALRTSKLVNVANRVLSRRLGHTGPENLAKVPANVVAVDCDLVNRRADPLGHTYFLDDPDGRPGAVLLHIARCIATGRPAPRPGPRHLRLVPRGLQNGMSSSRSSNPEAPPERRPEREAVRAGAAAAPKSSSATSWSGSGSSGASTSPRPPSSTSSPRKRGITTSVVQRS